MEKDMKKSSCRKSSIWEEYDLWEEDDFWGEDGFGEKSASLEKNCSREEDGSEVEFAIVWCLEKGSDDGNFEAIMIRLALMDKLVQIYRILVYMYSIKWLCMSQSWHLQFWILVDRSYFRVSACRSSGQETHVSKVAHNCALRPWGYIILLVGVFFAPHLIIFVSSLCYFCIVHRECRPFTVHLYSTKLKSRIDTQKTVQHDKRRKKAWRICLGGSQCSQ